jgi:hypothetical protein
MTRFGFFSAGLATAVLLLFAINPSHLDSAAPNAAPVIGTGNILFGDAQVIADRTAVRAFIPTDSTSRNCLVTFSESNFAIAGLALFCGQREFNGQQGIIISIPSIEPMPTGLILSVTAYQERAHGYGPPVLYTGP